MRRLLTPCLFEGLPLGLLALPEGLWVPGFLMSLLAGGGDVGKEALGDTTLIFRSLFCAEHPGPFLSGSL